jgi:hypothetical protein
MFVCLYTYCVCPCCEYRLKYKAYVESLRALRVGDSQTLLVDFTSVPSYVNSASSAYSDTLYRNAPPTAKLKLRACKKWPGVYYYETIGETIQAGEEVFSLYCEESNTKTIDQDGIDIGEVNNNMNNNNDNDDDGIEEDEEGFDPSVCSQDFSQTACITK